MTKISQLSSIGDSLAIGDQFLIRDIDDTGSPNKSVTVSGITRALDVGTALAPAIAFASDKNTGIYSPGADQLAVATNGSERLRITSAGLVGIGTTSPNIALTIGAGAASTGAVIPTTDIAFPSAYANGFFRAVGSYNQGAGTGGTIQLGGKSYTDSGFVGAFLISALSGSNTTDALTFSTQTSFNNVVSEKMRLDSSGRLLVGTSSALLLGSSLANFAINNETLVGAGLVNHNIGATRHGGTVPEAGPVICLARSRGTTIGAVTLVANGDTLGILEFSGADGTDFGTTAASIKCEVDGTPGANDMPGRLVFSTTADGAASPTERMRITQSGQAWVGSYNQGGLGSQQLAILPALNSDIIGLFINRSGSDGAVAEFACRGNIVGNITVAASSTAYNTSSDYRLKENVAEVTDGITRLQQLKPSRFNFIADPDKTVDGFIAHEVQDIVPEAITGEKDAVDDDGNPVYQGIDQSKLVPLLTAALQEAIGEIESLKARVAALEAQ